MHFKKKSLSVGAEQLWRHALTRPALYLAVGAGEGCVRPTTLFENKAKQGTPNSRRCSFAKCPCDTSTVILQQLTTAGETSNLPFLLETETKRCDCHALGEAYLRDVLE